MSRHSIPKMKRVGYLVPLISILGIRGFAGTAEMISPAEGDAVVSYFHQFADSPDGSRIAYTLFNPPDKMQVMVQDLSTGERTKVATVKGQNRHTGAHPLWVDDHTLIYCSDGDYKIYHHDLLSGKVVEFDGGQISDYSPLTHQLLYKNNKNPEKEEVGLYSLDLGTRERERIVGLNQVAPFKDLMGVSFPVEEWRLDHPYWSPDGTKILFQVKTTRSGSEEAKRKVTVFALVLDTSTRDMHFVGYRPMHVQWWDNQSIFGHDNLVEKDKHLRRYDLNGNLIEELSGPGCHATVSSDRKWIVTESWYRSDPIIVQLYGRGELEPIEAIFAQAAVVKGKAFWEIRSHVHPTFSRNGERVFFNGQGSDGKSKVWSYDLRP